MSEKIRRHSKTSIEGSSKPPATGPVVTSSKSEDGKLRTPNSSRRSSGGGSHLKKRRHSGHKPVTSASSHAAPAAPRLLHPDRGSPADLPVVSISTLPPKLPPKPPKGSPSRNEVADHRSTVSEATVTQATLVRGSFFRKKNQKKAAPLSLPQTRRTSIAYLRSLDASLSEKQPSTVKWSTEQPTLRGLVSSAMVRNVRPFMFMKQFQDRTQQFASTGERTKLSGATVTAAVCCLLLFVTFLSIILVVRIKSGIEAEDNSGCPSGGCGEFQHVLDAIVNHSADPCKNFDAFVCSKWQTDNEESLSGLRATSTQSVMVRRWLNGFQRLLITGARNLTVGKKAMAMYDSCTASGRQPSKDALKAFMNLTNLSWPEESKSDANAFGILLDLAYNWNVPLWFRVVVLPEDAYHKKLRIFISLNPQMAQWQAILDELGSIKTYMVYWTSFYNQLASDAESKIPSERTIINSYRILKTILGTFLKKDTYADEALLQLSLEDASKSMTSVKNMTELVNEHLDYGANFSAHDLLVFAEARLLQALNSTFARYSNGDVLNHISWLFVQAHGPIVDPFNLLLSRHGSKSVAQEELPRYCAAQVEASYPMMTSALFAVSRFSLRERQYISDQLKHVADSFLLGVANATWLDRKSRKAATRKITGVKTVLWPPNEFLAQTGLSALYELFPSNETTFSDFWIQTRQALRLRRVNDPQYNSEPLEAPGSYALPLVTYEHALNSVFVAMAALTRPLYYTSDTKAMTYGGLGFQYARQLLRAIDKNGASLDGFGRPVPRWLSSQSSAALQERARCYGVTDYNTLLDVAALEVAYNAYSTAPPIHERNVFGEITPAQVFFISVCYASCSQKRLYSVEQCSKVVTGFRPFADAFTCGKLYTPKSGINCTIFY